MKNSFNKLIDSFIENKIGLAENFLNASLALHLKENLLSLYSENKFQNAGTGNEKIILNNKLIRGDKIFWLDRKHNNKYESEFFDLMDAFILYLNNTCYTGITGYEFHYSLYEKGSFYKKHLDQFKNNSSRKYSMIMYLNNNWEEIDGGQLRIHHTNSIQNISPDNRKIVFFKSNELEHEVLITNKDRLSVTGWLKVN